MVHSWSAQENEMILPCEIYWFIVHRWSRMAHKPHTGLSMTHGGMESVGLCHGEKSSSIFHLQPFAPS